MIAVALENAIDDGGILKVRYFGGSTPGAERQIQPISIKNGAVRAKCLQSGDTKTFIIEKMELVIDGVPSQLASTLPPPIVVYESLGQLFTNQTVALQKLGWIVQGDEDHISLYRTYKNGKIRGSYDVIIRYEATITEYVIDENWVEQAIHRPRARPWYIGAKGNASTSYVHFDKAQLAFLQYAELLAPAK